MAKLKLIQIRVNAEEHQRIRSFARKSNLEMSTYMREVGLLGYTFQLQATPPAEIQVESMTIERSEGNGVGKVRKRASG